MVIVGVIISVIWGGVAAQLFLQAWLAFINMLINIWGLLFGKAEKQSNLIGIGMGFGMALLFSVLLSIGFFVIGDVLKFGYTSIENIVFWIAGGISFIVMVPQIPSKLKRTWEMATVFGAV